MNQTAKTAFSLLIFLAAGGALYYYQDEWKRLFAAEPCTEPISYSLGQFDARFGMSQAQFLKKIEESEKIWEDYAGKELFQYDPQAEFKINLIYDYRQKTADELSRVGDDISTDRAIYDKLKQNYEALSASYEKAKKAFETRVARFEDNKEEYEKEVAYWNEQGGAPPEKYQELQKEKEGLDREAKRINTDQDNLNALANQANAAVADLNAAAQRLNKKVGVFNTIGATTGDEFSEGEYVRDSEGERINIYHFDDQPTLLRVLEHELGHGLGLEHTEDPDSIMYPLNLGKKNVLTEDDKAELDKVCKAE